MISLELLKSSLPITASLLEPPASTSELEWLHARGMHTSVVDLYAAYNGSVTRRKPRGRIYVGGGLLGCLPTPQAARWAQSARFINLDDARRNTAREDLRAYVGPSSIVIGTLTDAETRSETELAESLRLSEDPDVCNVIVVDGSGEMVAVESNRPMRATSLGMSLRAYLIKFEHDLTTALVTEVEDRGLLKVSVGARPTNVSPPASGVDRLIALLFEQELLRFERADACTSLRVSLTGAIERILKGKSAAKQAEHLLQASAAVDGIKFASRAALVEFFKRY